MSEGMVIASMMICGLPTYLNNRLILSSCDSVWIPVENLSLDIKQYLTDELGNSNVDYGGFVQMIDPYVLQLIAKQNLFACFRVIENRHMRCVDAYPPRALYQDLIQELKIVGWDIATGNGWLSASCHGRFPIDPFTGKTLDKNHYKINKFGLFDSIDDCEIYCRINNEEILEHSPWLPVAIYVDKSTFNRLIQYYNKRMGENGTSLKS